MKTNLTRQKNNNQAEALSHELSAVPTGQVPRSEQHPQREDRRN
jgi:hypothetical protein